MREDYLLDVNLSRIPALEAEVLVIGSGVAGCSAAIAAATVAWNGMEAR